MRLFAAVPVAEPARAEVLGVLGRLRDSEWPVRWVQDEGLHLTLKFFGEVAPERLEVIEEATRIAGQDAGTLALTLGDLGAFPSETRARVLWLGLEGTPSLAVLQDRLERAGEAIGFPPEGAPFQAHVTLGRVREGLRCPPHGLDDYRAMYNRVAFIGTQLVLYESVLTTRGPRYQARLTLDLGA
ncbi:MAG: RNA 2',3'-cyclic phosphodiesterase [Gemmatimonadales bacterium]